MQIKNRCRSPSPPHSSISGKGRTHIIVACPLPYHTLPTLPGVKPFFLFVPSRRSSSLLFFVIVICCCLLLLLLVGALMLCCAGCAGWLAGWEMRACVRACAGWMELLRCGWRLAVVVGGGGGFELWMGCMLFARCDVISSTRGVYIFFWGGSERDEMGEGRGFVLWLLLHTFSDWVSYMRHWASFVNQSRFFAAGRCLKTCVAGKKDSCRW